MTMSFEQSRTLNALGMLAVCLVLLLALAVLNAVSALLECGPALCADPPTSYKLIDELTNRN